MKILSVQPTVLMRRRGGELQQLIRVRVRNEGAPGPARLTACAGPAATEQALPVVPAGESTHDFYFGARAAPAEVQWNLTADGQATDRHTEKWTPPRPWTVHLVHLSHHDVGYTDLASHVVPEHDRWLDATLDMVAATRDFPEDARFRIVVEQAWSIDHYLKHAHPARAALMIDLLRRGEFELTALFGNMVTELCGHETLARGLYHAYRLKRLHGIPILSAEHNDIPGITWGLSQLLINAGIRFFCPSPPNFYAWGNPEAISFWDERAIFGIPGIPGAFWWEAPNGKRLLFWCNNQGTGGDCRPTLPMLADRLRQLETQGFPYTVLRWPVQGAARDNSPYIEAYAHTVKAWNEQWVYPRLILSTNTRFYRDLLPQLPPDLPVFRGDLPGQDYPMGVMSTAAATGVNRRNHIDVPAAETLATAASLLSDYAYQAGRIEQAYEEMLWHDEHTWGHHFPAGPTAVTAEMEKSIHAHRAAALAHDVLNKAMARIADAVQLENKDLHLVVFNPLPRVHSGIVQAPLREIDNCGSDIVPLSPAEDPQGTGHLRGALLQTRWHVNPPPDIAAGQFDLIDVATGASIPYQVVPIESAMDPVPYSAQRLGVGSGTRRYGFFEMPIGLKCTLCFRADDIPALGYRTYRLAPRTESPVFPSPLVTTANSIANEFFRLELDPGTGLLRSLRDRRSGRELLDSAAADAFGEVLVRDPGDKLMRSSMTGFHVRSGPLCATLQVWRTAPGHPQIVETFTLHAGVRTVEFAVHIVKDSTPLLETYLAFPFHCPDGEFRYETPWSVLTPIRDFLPGAYADRLTVQNWVQVRNPEFSLLWSSLDSPVVSLGRLWPGRVSPAHSALPRADLHHPRQTAGDLRGGLIYSCLFANNFGTNFIASQSGAALFRYVFTLREGAVTDAAATAFGQESNGTLPAIFTKHPGPRMLPPARGFLSIDNPAVHLTTLKRAEDGRGWILRLWNPGERDENVTVVLPFIALRAVQLTTLTEEDTETTIAHGKHDFGLCLAARDIATIRLEIDIDR